jgi:hypothetical protein
LRISGIRTSLRRVLRLMRENDLLAPVNAGLNFPRNWSDPRGMDMSGCFN